MQNHGRNAVIVIAAAVIFLLAYANAIQNYTSDSAEAIGHALVPTILATLGFYHGSKLFKKKS